MNEKFKSKMMGYVAAFILPLLASCTFADDFQDNIPSDKMSRESAQIKIEGMFDFKAGGRSQSNLEADEKSVSGDKNGFALSSSAAIFVSAQDKTESGMTYGARITLVSKTKTSGSNSYNGSHLFFKHDDYGKFELGSAADAASAMRIDANESAAVGGGWDAFAVLDPKFIKYGPDGAESLAPEFATDFDFLLDDETPEGSKNTGRVERSRKISYYTPKFKDMFQFGISYIPDSSNVGIAGSSSSGVETETVTIIKEQDVFELPKATTNAIAAGVTFEKDLAEETKLTVSLTGEHGKPSSKMKRTVTDPANPDNPTITQFQLSNLNTYNIGAELVHGNLSCSASYSDLGKSLTNSAYHKAGRKTKYYGGTLAYDYGPIRTSVSYNHFDKFTNKLDVFSLEGKVKLAPGLSSYAGIYRFSGKGRPVYYPDAEKKKLKGTAALIGAKIKF